MERTITTEEAARLAGVTASTIKRWADEGGLPCVRTAGGHRRFKLEDVKAFVALGTDASPGERTAPGTPGEWIKTWRSGTPWAIDASLFLARSALGRWHLVAEAVGDAVTEMGLQWEKNLISVADEHIATTALQRSLGRISDSLLVAPDAPRCALATPDGEQHVVGLSLAELALREAGWMPVWMGASTPARDLASMVVSEQVSMVALSASSFSIDAAMLDRYLAELEPVCAEAKIPVIAGGSAPWPKRATRMSSFEALHGFAVGERMARQAKGQKR